MELLFVMVALHLVVASFILTNRPGNLFDLTSRQYHAWYGLRASQSPILIVT